jgi:predicted metal-binding protein
MSKLLTIDNCSQCKYRSIRLRRKKIKGNKYKEIIYYRVCMKKRNKGVKTIAIPSWCPLPDAEGCPFPK